MRIRRCVFLVLAASLATGCGRSAVKPPSVDPGDAADKAVELCDKDANKLLTAAELVACPGLLAALSQYDTSGDKQLSRDEIVERLTSMYAKSRGFSSFRCRVLRDNVPLSGAHVRLVPEPFLGGDVKSAEGDTDGSGNASIGVAEAELPENARGLKVIQLGVYRVEITHPTAKIPAQFNTQTTLGYEHHPTNSDEAVVFRVRSK